MKTKILPIVLSFFLISFFAHSMSPEAFGDHVSLQIKGGVNKHRGVPKFEPSVGISAEYSISPLLGIGVECFRMNVSEMPGNYAQKYSEYYSWNRPSAVYQTVAYLSLNLRNIGMRSSGIFNPYLNLGLGAGVGDWGYKESVNANFALMAGLNFEFNVSQHIAIGLEVRYWWNSNPKYFGACQEGVSDKERIAAGDWKIGFYEANLGIRYKFTTWKGRGNHMRNADIRSFRFFK